MSVGYGEPQESAQQSGCFDVVERGVAMQNLQQERALGQSGELRQESDGATGAVAGTWRYAHRAGGGTFNGYRQ